ncbi:hypothetical protein BY996DRAFT_6470475 [Phakopsora pachyrhizi]|nr:hypothetical protein BY996DRAFT_6470475 [Phakopsora pachyrhizi]
MKFNQTRACHHFSRKTQEAILFNSKQKIITINLTFIYIILSSQPTDNSISKSVAEKKINRDFDHYNSKSISPDDGDDNSLDDTENSESEKHIKVGKLLEAKDNFYQETTTRRRISALLTDRPLDKNSHLRELKELKTELLRADRRILANDSNTVNLGSLEIEIRTGSSFSGKAEELEKEGNVGNDENESGRKTPTNKSVGYRLLGEDQSSKTMFQLHKKKDSEGRPRIYQN